MRHLTNCISRCLAMSRKPNFGPNLATGQYSGQVRPPRGGGINQLSWKIGEENSSSPPKNFIWQWKISPISHISSLLLLNSSQFNSFCNFWEGKTQNFWRYAPILVQIDMSSSPSPHARAKNWGRKHVPSTVGVGKETGSVARILTSVKAQTNNNWKPKTKILT